MIIYELDCKKLGNIRSGGFPLIDIHCHLLPGVDDGAKDFQESIEMAKAATAEGITHIVATPHHNNGKYSNSKEQIIAKVREMQDALQKENIPLTILPGQELRINGDILQDYENGKLLTLNDAGKYVLIELPSNHVPRYTEQILFDFQMKELTPIIVHPERNQEIIENPEILYQLVKKGACTQITASSVTGHFGKKIKKFALDLIEANLTHFIASDAHNVTTRPFRMQEAYEMIEKEFGFSTVFYFRENAELVIEGRTIYREIPQRIKKKKFLGLF
jgi:protein-tyrosine phosphatase